jgi:hypothetical protein
VGGQRHAQADLPQGKTLYPLYRRLGGPILITVEFLWFIESQLTTVHSDVLLMIQYTQGEDTMDCRTFERVRGVANGFIGVKIVLMNQWRTEGGAGLGCSNAPRNSEVLTKSNRISN